MKQKDYLIAAFTVALLGLLAYFWFSPAGLKAAPNISLNAIDESPINLEQYRGKPLLVTFWATTCPGCVAEIPHFSNLYRELNPKGFNILVIAMDYDPPEQVRFVVKQRAMPYTVALDTDGAAARAFGNVKLTPTTFLIDPQGRIVQQKLGEVDIEQLRNKIIGML